MGTESLVYSDNGWRHLFGPICTIWTSWFFKWTNLQKDFTQLICFSVLRGWGLDFVWFSVCKLRVEPRILRLQNLSHPAQNSIEVSWFKALKMMSFRRAWCVTCFLAELTLVGSGSWPGRWGVLSWQRATGKYCMIFAIGLIFKAPKYPLNSSMDPHKHKYPGYFPWLPKHHQVAHHPSKMPSRHIFKSQETTCFRTCTNWSKHPITLRNHL